MDIIYIYNNPSGELEYETNIREYLEATGEKGKNELLEAFAEISATVLRIYKNM